MVVRTVGLLFESCIDTLLCGKAFSFCFLPWITGTEWFDIGRPTEHGLHGLGFGYCWTQVEFGVTKGDA